MPRNRISYNCLGVFVGKTGNAIVSEERIGDITQLKGIQSFDFNINRNYQNIEELGSLSIAAQIENENPSINASLSYNLIGTPNPNEPYMGFLLTISDPNTQRPALRNIISGNLQQNYYFLISKEGTDLNYSNINDGISIIGLGNACLTSYELNASVGDITTVNIELDALNIKYYKNIDPLWGKNQIIEPFVDSLFDSKIKLTNYNDNSDLMIVGFPNDNIISAQDGPARLYIQNNNTKTFEFYQNLTGASSFTTAPNLERYGYSIAASNSGKYIVVGGPDSNNYTGAALLYTRNSNNTWSFVRKLSGVNNNAAGPIFAPYGARYGTNVAISKNSEIMCISGPYDESNYGGVLIYTGNFNSPSYKITGSSPYTMGLGLDMNESGNIIILGGGSPFYFDGLTDIYTGNKNVGWKLAQSITGENGHQHGRTCKINDKGDVIVLGGVGSDNSILIYTGDAKSRWDFAQKIIGSVPSVLFGQDISIDSNANTIVVGYGNYATYPDNNGWVSIYTGNPQSKWNLYQILSGKNENDEFGHSTAINSNGSTIAVTAFGEPYLSYNGTYYVLYENSIKGLPSIDPEEIINTNELSFALPSPTNEFQTNVFLPGDIIFKPSGYIGYDEDDLKIQDFKLLLKLDRTPLRKLGKRYPFFREFNFPIKMTVELNALVGDLKSNNLYNILCGQQNYNFDIEFNLQCPRQGSGPLFYRFNNAKLISQNFTNEIGNNSTMNAIYEIDVSDITQNGTLSNFRINAAGTIL